MGSDIDILKESSICHTCNLLVFISGVFCELCHTWLDIKCIKINQKHYKHAIYAFLRKDYKEEAKIAEPFQDQIERGETVTTQQVADKFPSELPFLNITLNNLK